MFQVVLIITAFGAKLPVLIRLEVFIPAAAWPADNKKAKKVCLIWQLESTYGTCRTTAGLVAADV